MSACHVFICHGHIYTLTAKSQTTVHVNQFCNGLNVLRFSCCLLFCVGGNPIGGLRKSQSKCFQMMMSCRRKKKKKRKKKIRKGFQRPYSVKKGKKSRSPHAYILLARGRLCCKTTLYSASVYHFRFLCAKLGRNVWPHWRSIIAAWFQAINQRVVFKLVGATVEERQS